MEDRFNEELKVDELHDWPDDFPETELIGHNPDDYSDELPEMAIINHNLNLIGD